MPASSITKPCHNCRRRRLRCDRSWPSCHKCASSGQECLGYGKVFVWTQVIDCHGYPGLPPPPVSGRRLSDPCQYQAEEVPEYRAPPPRGGEEQHHSMMRPCPHSHLKEITRGEVDRQARFALRDGNFSDDATSSDQTSPDEDGDASFGSSELVPPDQRLDMRRLSTPANLTDPLFQDLDRNSRCYLAHFADSVCKDLVARDTPNSNPFRELIPLANNHPLLLQILIATSAVHWSNMFRHVRAIPAGSADPGGYLAKLRSQDFASRQALIDALTAKQKAMGHLHGVLDTLDSAGSEVALAAMHFFVKFDLIDLDQQNNDKGWQTHMEGTSSILALLAPDSARPCSSGMLRDCVIADCYIYHVLGSTLATRAIASRIARHAFELVPVIKRVEVSSYLSCPPEILQVMLLASQLSYETPCTDWSLSAADQALALIDEALAFDIGAWADRLREMPNVSDIESRMHIASAHRSAVCLYILQALPSVRAVRPVDTMFLVGDIVGHLGQIDEQDPYFKATSWPMFIAGAETRDAEKRAWAMSRMFAIWKICPWGYIFTAMEMLKATWQRQDSGRGSGVRWLQDLKDMGFEYLIV